MKRTLATLLGLLAATATAGHAATLPLTGTANGTGRFTDFFSNAYAQINLEPDGFYDLGTNAPVGGGFDVFPREAAFDLGTLSYNEAGLFGLGPETAPVTGLTLDVFGNIDHGNGTYSTTLNNVAGTVSFFNGAFTGLALTSDVTFQVTDGFFTGVTHSEVAGLTFSGTGFNLAVDDTFNAAGGIRWAWEVAGTNVQAVPEPGSVALLLAGGAGAFGLHRLRCGRRRRLVASA